MWAAGINSSTLNGRSWDTERWWLTCIKPLCKLMAKPGPKPRSPARRPVDPPPCSQLESVSKGIWLSFRRWLLPYGSQSVEMQPAASKDPPSRGLFHEHLYLTPGPNPRDPVSGLKNASTSQAFGGGGSEASPLLLFPSRSLELEPWKSHALQGGGRRMTAASRLFQRTLRWQEYFPVEINPIPFAFESGEHSWWKSRQHDIVWTLKAGLMLLWLVLPLAHTEDPVRVLERSGQSSFSQIPCAIHILKTVYV